MTRYCVTHGRTGSLQHDALEPGEVRRLEGLPAFGPRRVRRLFFAAACAYAPGVNTSAARGKPMSPEGDSLQRRFSFL
jgi:hypothetical protein